MIISVVKDALCAEWGDVFLLLSSLGASGGEKKDLSFVRKGEVFFCCSLPFRLAFLSRALISRQVILNIPCLGKGLGKFITLVYSMFAKPHAGSRGEGGLAR